VGKIMCLCAYCIIFLGKGIETYGKGFGVGLCMELRDLELRVWKIVMNEEIFDRFLFGWEGHYCKCCNFKPLN
jgi:hypothetical protein